MMFKSFNFKGKKEKQGNMAIAIHYDEQTGQLPQVIAKGRGQIAEHIMKLAEINQVPLQEDSTLIGNLIDMDLGDDVPPQLYSVIAEVLLLIEEMENNL